MNRGNHLCRVVPSVRHFYKMSFDQTTTLQFIFLYKQHEALWNPKDKSYYNSIKKEQAWKDISDILNVSVDDLQKKMESLRGSYRREKSRIRHKLKISDEECFSQWYAFEAMSFLDSRNPPGKLVDTSTSEIKTEYDFLDIEEHNLKTEQEERIEDEKDPLLIEITPKIDITNQSNERKRKRTNDLKFEEEKDGCFLFGEYISNKVKKLDPDLRVMAEHKINNILFELAMVQIKRKNSEATE